MDYAEALAWLYSTQDRGIKLGLDRVREFLAGLGWSQGGRRFLHVAGTNGKGSVCAMLEAVCRAAGVRTGLFTSPHLVSFRERIRVDGRPIAAAEIARGLTRIRNTPGAAQATFFEITTGLALEIFAREQCDVVILETGLGGRLDATNVVTPEAAVIVSIGLDHTQLLGGTLREIAMEKAGIIKPGVPVIVGALPPEAGEVIAGTAAMHGSRLIKVTQPIEGARVSLAGSHQRLNAAIALETLRAAKIPITDAQAAAGLASIDWPARFQDTGRGFILDGAHNPDAARRLAQTWRETFGDHRARIILGIVRDKDAAGICAALAPVAGQFIIVPVRSPRATQVSDLLAIASAFAPSHAAASLAEAIAASTPGGTPALITGSLFLAGEALCILGLAEGGQEMSAQ